MNPYVIGLLPMGILTATALLLLMFEVFSNQNDRSYYANVAVLGLLGAMYAVGSQISAPTVGLFGSDITPPALIVDGLSRASSLVMMAAGVLACLLSPGYVRNANCEHGEYYALILFAIVGMCVMVMAGDLITFFLGLETMSIAVYALTALRANDPRASEAALKYFLMGAFATGFLLFGIALIYGLTGSVALTDLARILSVGDPIGVQPLLGLGIALLLMGFAFKVAAVPFHMWAPDVYEGAPTPVTGFMAVAVKAAAFVALLRIVIVALPVGGMLWVSLLSVLAVMTIVVGNVLALVQKSIKRMLAYSSVSHAGYALIGVVAAAKGQSSAGAAVLFYLTTYTFMTLGAFGVLTFLERKDGGIEAERFGAYAGVGFKHPALGAAMALFMVALAGMPPTGGFFGKLYVFSAALDAGELGLVLTGVFGSIVSVYYYLRVIVAFYMREIPDPGPTPTATRSAQLGLGVAIAAAMVIYLGVSPGRWIALGQSAVQNLIGG